MMVRDFIGDAFFQSPKPSWPKDFFLLNLDLCILQLEAT